MKAKVFSLLFFLSFVGFGLVGCAKSSYYYSKSGVSDTQMESDSYQCHKENRYKKTNVYYNASTNYGFVNTTKKTNRAMWTKCMRARGYTVTTKSRSSRKPTAGPKDMVSCAKEGGISTMTRAYCSKIGGVANN
jgi:hypothetical protein